MASLTEERKIRIENCRSEKCDELFKKASSIDTIFNLVILVNKDNLPLLARIDPFTNYFFYSILQ